MDLMTNLRMFGKYFPCEIRLVEGTTPPTLGRDFFKRYSWSMNDDGMIKSPIGDIITKSKGEDHTKGRIEEVETERIFKCSEFFLRLEDEKDKRKILIKLHKYFGHVSPESLYRILKASSGKDRFTEADIRKVNDNCYT